MTSKYFISSISISLETAYESAICLEQICLEVSRSQDEKILAYHASLLLWPVPNACASRDTPTGLTREDGVRMSWGRRSKLSFEDVTHSPLSATCTPWSIEPHSHKRNRTATVAPQILLKRIIGKSSGLFVYIMISWDIQYSESRHSQVSFTAKKSIRPSSFELHRPPVPAAAFVGLPPSKYMRMLQNHMSCWKGHSFSFFFVFFQCLCLQKKKIPTSKADLVSVNLANVWCSCLSSKSANFCARSLTSILEWAGDMAIDWFFLDLRFCEVTNDAKETVAWTPLNAADRSPSAGYNQNNMRRQKYNGFVPHITSSFMHPKQTNYLGKLITTLSQSLTSFRRKKRQRRWQRALVTWSRLCLCLRYRDAQSCRSIWPLWKVQKLSIEIQFWISNQHIINPFGLPPYKSQKVKICSLHLPITS